MKLALNEIKAPHKKDRDSLNLENLIQSIREIGMVEPIVVNERNEIVSGRRRYYAAKELQLEKVDVTYYEKDKTDTELAAIDSNLMVLPLGDVDHDVALLKRKKLYEQKYPDSSRKTAEKEEKAFTKDVADIMGITRRSVELAIARAEKASAQVSQARRDGKVSSTIVNELIKLPASYQDKLLEAATNKSVAEVKTMVEDALQKNAEYAIMRAERMENVFYPQPLAFAMHRLKKALIGFLDEGFKIEARDLEPLVMDTKELLNLLQKFLSVKAAVPKPILRRAQPEARA